METDVPSVTKLPDGTQPDEDGFSFLTSLRRRLLFTNKLNGSVDSSSGAMSFSAATMGLIIYFMVHASTRMCCRFQVVIGRMLKEERDHASKSRIAYEFRFLSFVSLCESI